MEGKYGVDSASLQRLDFAGFAQEFLRRNPSYRAEYRALMARDTLENAEVGQEVMARRWGLCFSLCAGKTGL